MPEYPNSFNIKLPNFNIPLAILAVITLLAVFLAINSLIAFIFFLTLWLLIAFINIYLHEKSHQYVIEQIGKTKCEIKYCDLTPNCSFDEPVEIPVYRIGCLAPLIPLSFIFLFTIIALLTPYFWLKAAFVFATLFGLCGMYGDIYFFIVTRKYQKGYLIIDHGKEVTLIKKQI